MKKKYLILALVAILVPLPIFANEDGENEGIEQELATVRISVNGTQIHITGAMGKTLEIYDVLGVRVGTIKIDSEEKTLNLNLKRGCYILKLEKVVRKVSIK
ncbi:MAG: T9SS type A sorting domain-containing protein [Bacteroidaceae bacterium]|nr:T9SS type A sorting domain-containing protein [Bacteroidaceae bacterium]